MGDAFASSAAGTNCAGVFLSQVNPRELYDSHKYLACGCSKNRCRSRINTAQWQRMLGNIKTQIHTLTKAPLSGKDLSFSNLPTGERVSIVATPRLTAPS